MNPQKKLFCIFILLFSNVLIAQNINDVFKLIIPDNFKNTSEGVWWDDDEQITIEIQQLTRCLGDEAHKIAVKTETENATILYFDEGDDIAGDIKFPSTVKTIKKNGKYAILLRSTAFCFKDKTYIALIGTPLDKKISNNFEEILTDANKKISSSFFYFVVGVQRVSKFKSIKPD